jgi:hypothetical protein
VTVLKNNRYLQILFLRQYTIKALIIPKKERRYGSGFKTMCCGGTLPRFKQNHFPAM